MNILLDILKNNFLPCTLNAITVIYLISKILNCKIDFNKPKVYIITFISIVLSIINYMYVDSYVRILVSTIYTIIYSYILFKENINKVTIAVILEQAVLFIAELLYMLIVILILKIEVVFDSVQGTLLTNIFICVIAILLINTKLVSELCNKVMNYMDKIKQKNKYALVLIIIITVNVLLMIIYINSKNVTMVIMNVIFIFVYSYIVYLLLNEKHTNVIFKEENKSLLENLNEYEKMLDYQRVANHENKNQLLVIKTMASKNNKKLHSYIDEVIKEKREDNEILYTKAKNIPSGGLQGLVYQKMLLMQERNINIDLNVSKEIRKVELSELNAKTNFDICRVMGIIIDNAIDEVTKLKDKEISISMYKEDNVFIIETSNKCKEVPDLDKIDNKGYTTKESGHGYGLSLLKEICEKNKGIINERKIMSNIFTQIIKIKL